MGLSYQLGAHPQDLLSVCSVLPRLEALGLNRSRDQDSGPYGHLSGPSLWAIFSLIPNSVRMLQLSGYGLGIEEEAHARDREEATEKELKSVPPPPPSPTLPYWQNNKFDSNAPELSSGGQRAPCTLASCTRGDCH